MCRPSIAHYSGELLGKVERMDNQNVRCLRMQIVRNLAASLLFFLGSPGINAAEVYSVGPITLTPTYNVAGCALVTSNGYGGTDRRLFIPNTDGYYSIKDYTPGASTFWLITDEAFDPNQRLVDQALAVDSSWGGGSYPPQASLVSGGRYYAWAAYGGGYGTVGDCQSDGATETVSFRIVGEDSGVPSPPSGISATPTDGGATVSFIPGSANGSAITNYEYGTFNGVEWTFTALNPVDATSPISITGLTNGVSVTMRLRAVNANGASAHSSSFTFTPEAPVVADADGDGVGDGIDNCPSMANAGQTDTDGDGAGNACDADDDGDSIADGSDNCPLNANANQDDFDSDGAGDICDSDDDGDGVVDATDNCPLVPNTNQSDTSYGAAGAYVQKIFIAFVGRPPAPSGLRYYADLISANNTTGKLILFDDLFYGADATSIYSGMTLNDRINQYYNFMFNRYALVGGLNYWSNQINSGVVTQPEAAATIANSASGQDMSVLDAKQTAASKLTCAMDTAAKISAYQSNLSGARSSIASVDTAQDAAAYDGTAALLSITGISREAGSYQRVWTSPAGDAPLAASLVGPDSAAPTPVPSLPVGWILTLVSLMALGGTLKLKRAGL